MASISQMTDSVLLSVKKSLGIDADYTVFDADLILAINSAFSVLHQLGVGPDTPFMIFGSGETWDEFIDSEGPLAMVKTYVFLKTKVIFDPPTAGFVLDAYNKQIAEYEWRMNVEVETPAVSEE